MDENKNPPTPNTPEEKAPAGPFVGILIVTIVIILGGFYLLFVR